MNLQEIRDLIVIISGSLLALLLLVSIIVVLVVGIAARGLMGALRGVIEGKLSPTLDSAKAVVDDIRGTTGFIADTTVSPIIRVYGLVGGVRRGMMALAGFGRKRQPPKK